MKKSLKNVIAGGEDKSAIAVTQIKDLDSCSMGSISHEWLGVTSEWLGVTSAEALTPAWTICFQC